jgi:hypothetical protein
VRLNHVSHLLVAALLAITASSAGAQLRRRAAGGAGETRAEHGTPRDPRFPYAGLWSGTRVMPVGSDQIRLRFTVKDGKYLGVTIHPGGDEAPQINLTATAAGLRWEQPNSGGGTWIFNVRLASPDSLAGTLILRDAPANFTEIPSGTMALTRQPPDAGSGKP